MVSELKNSSLFQIANLVAGMFLGATGGVFFLGMLVPRANTPVSVHSELPLRKSNMNELMNFIYYSHLCHVLQIVLHSILTIQSTQPNRAYT